MFSKPIYLSHCVNKHLLAYKILTKPKEKPIIHECHYLVVVYDKEEKNLLICQITTFDRRRKNVYFLVLS